MLMHGWGRYPRVDARSVDLASVKLAHEALSQVRSEDGAIARGAGRSYGDSSLSAHVINTRNLDSFLAFDSDSGILTCESGVSIASVLEVAVPKGWLLPVVPGTKFPTIGGAISSDIHGKNHHLDGSFSDHVVEFELLLADGSLITCSREQNQEIFMATCGGMGLTGVILTATLQLARVGSSLIEERVLVAENLEEVFRLIEKHKDSKYSVAWLDCMAKGDLLGRSILFLGEHVEKGELEIVDKRSISVPFSSPAFLLNRYSMKVFNATYFSVKRRGAKQRQVHYDSYFFPLDSISHWNRLYGSKGFIQYQFVMPMETAFEGIKEVLNEIVSAGKGSFLTVLKMFGEANQNFLSFPTSGYTLALDFKYEASLLPILDRLDAVVLAHGGRLYLAKDARMSKAVFTQCYPRWQEFKKVRDEIDPTGMFASSQSRRLGL